MNGCAVAVRIQLRRAHKSTQNTHRNVAMSARARVMNARASQNVRCFFIWAQPKSSATKKRKEEAKKKRRTRNQKIKLGKNVDEIWKIAKGRFMLMFYLFVIMVQLIIRLADFYSV